MDERRRFESEMNALKRESGPKAVTKTYLIFAEVVHWLHRHGHGNITLFAVNKTFGSKFRTDSVFTVSQN